MQSAVSKTIKFRTVDKPRTTHLPALQVPLGRRPGVLGLIQKRNLRSVLRKSFPVHEHAMPAPKINRLVIPVPDLSARIDFGVAHHAAPAELPRFWVACD